MSTSAAGGEPDRRSPWRAAAVAGISLLVLAGIAYGGWRLLQSPAGRNAAVCPSAAPSVATVPAVAVRVLNGTARPRLAGQTAELLRQRGFRIAGVGNAPRVSGRPQLRYGTREAADARITALHVPGAMLVADRRVTNRVDVILGGSFRRLRTPAEAAALTKQANTALLRSASASPCR